MSRELLQQSGDPQQQRSGTVNQQQQSQQMKEQARVVGKLGEALHQVTHSLHDISPTDWFTIGSQISDRIAEENDRFNQMLSQYQSNYVSQTQQRQRRHTA